VAITVAGERSVFFAAREGFAGVIDTQEQEAKEAIEAARQNMTQARNLPSSLPHSTSRSTTGDHEV
jgi:hypothetical protein